MTTKQQEIWDTLEKEEGVPETQSEYIVFMWAFLNRCHYYDCCEYSKEENGDGLIHHYTFPFGEVPEINIQTNDIFNQIKLFENLSSKKEVKLFSENFERCSENLRNYGVMLMDDPIFVLHVPVEGELLEGVGHKTNGKYTSFVGVLKTSEYVLIFRPRQKEFEVYQK